MAGSSAWSVSSASAGGGGGDVTRLSLRDTARLAEVAGKMHAAMYAASDDQPFLRALLADALEGVDRVRGRCTWVAAARPWPVEEHPRLPRQAPPAAAPGGGDPLAEDRNRHQDPHQNRQDRQQGPLTNRPHYGGGPPT
ncbi:hypothetical protein GCM10027570_07410 [Streptomonospora sediminis]